MRVVAAAFIVQVHASLIVVLTRGGSTGRLVAKYRPLVPVLTVAVPVLTTDSLTWTCSNEAPARQVGGPAAGGCFRAHGTGDVSSSSSVLELLTASSPANFDFCTVTAALAQARPVILPVNPCKSPQWACYCLAVWADIVRLV